MKSKKFASGVFMLILVLMLSAWTSSSKQNNSDNTIITDQNKIKISQMHSGSGEVPKGLKEAKNPAYKVGSQVIVNADHMKGMYGAKAVIKGAYDTTAYVVTYKPTTGGPLVTHHKWVIQEEIKNAGTTILKPGTEVTLEANHMKGMMGAKGTINSAVYTTVYMIDYIPTTGGPIVKNHKWVIESELSAE
ncbi:YdhK family protein [Neobacillus mesonae]|uniref:YdhK family protein n=1 Tax=Neobacillus mesonae TaxID=1193713 RepID=UPI00204122FE|nr:YdhK family protein [Neobacillus mesonae]MCM3571305.1 YdhK family protein [Neobacillus mesonae]